MYVDGVNRGEGSTPAGRVVKVGFLLRGLTLGEEA